jgi:hypothetical protein
MLHTVQSVDARSEKRGTLPVIVTNGDSITFIMKISVGPSAACDLVIRCDRDGGIHASLKRS